MYLSGTYNDVGSTVAESFSVMILRFRDAVVLLLLVRRMLVTAVVWRWEPLLEDSEADSGF